MSRRTAATGYALSREEEAALDFKVWSQIKQCRHGCDLEFLSRLDRSTKDWNCFYYNEDGNVHSAMAPQKGQIIAALERLVDGSFIRLPKKGSTKTYKVAKNKEDPRGIEEEEEEEVDDDDEDANEEEEEVEEAVVVVPKPTLAVPPPADGSAYY